MKKCTVGIDAHKESNVLALAFNDMQPSTVYGKISTDLNRTGHLTAVHIPDVDDEVVRDVCRGRTDAVNDLKTSKKQLIYTESGWDILKIADELCRKLEGELPKHDDKRQRDSIRKKDF